MNKWIRTFQGRLLNLNKVEYFWVCGGHNHEVTKEFFLRASLPGEDGALDVLKGPKEECDRVLGLLTAFVINDHMRMFDVLQNPKVESITTSKREM